MAAARKLAAGSDTALWKTYNDSPKALAPLAAGLESLVRSVKEAAEGPVDSAAVPG